VFNAPAHHVRDVVGCRQVVLQRTSLLDERGKDQQRLVAQHLIAQRLAETDVVLQETQDGGVEQNLPFSQRQANEFIERIFALQDFGLIHRTQFAFVFVGQQDERSGQ